MDITAEMLAGEPVAELVDPANQKKQHPEGPDVVGAFAGERIQGGRVVLDSSPITCQ
jgi:hypothetical protein